MFPVLPRKRSRYDVINMGLEAKKMKESYELFVIIVIVSNLIGAPVERIPKLFRKRWDEGYLIDLAVRERSFVSEYRLDPTSFDLLCEMLSPALQFNPTKACNSCPTSCPISYRSRVAQTLIRLRGGRQ